MEILSQEYALCMALNQAVDREELLLVKYDQYTPELKNNVLKELIMTFRKDAEGHIKDFKDRMIKLNIQK